MVAVDPESVKVPKIRKEWKEEREGGEEESGQEELEVRNWNEIKYIIYSLFRHSPQDLCPSHLQHNFRMSLVRGEEDLWLVHNNYHRHGYTQFSTVHVNM